MESKDFMLSVVPARSTDFIDLNRRLVVTCIGVLESCPFAAIQKQLAHFAEPRSSCNEIHRPRRLITNTRTLENFYNSLSSSTSSMMLQPRIPHALSPSTPTLSSLAASFTALSITARPNPHHPSHQQKRNASHATQGRANGPTDSAGRRLGLKRSATQYVVPGNIIFRQRGTKWFPGENAGIGRDHTIFAKVAGYVRYYSDPMGVYGDKRGRRYIGVTLEREGKGAVLPTPGNKGRGRRLGMTAVGMKIEGGVRSDAEVEAREFLEGHVSEGSKGAGTTLAKAPPIMRAREYRIANAELARQAEEKKVKVREFDRKDRFYAWRVRVRKMKEKKLARAALGKSKKKAQRPAAKQAARKVMKSTKK